MEVQERFFCWCSAGNEEITIITIQLSYVVVSRAHPATFPSYRTSKPSPTSRIDAFRLRRRPSRAARMAAPLRPPAGVYRSGGRGAGPAMGVSRKWGCPQNAEFPFWFPVEKHTKRGALKNHTQLLFFALFLFLWGGGLGKVPETTNAVSVANKKTLKKGDLIWRKTISEESQANTIVISAIQFSLFSTHRKQMVD